MPGAPLVKAVKEIDSTRPVTAALANVPMSDAVGFVGNILDVVGYNYPEARWRKTAKYPKRASFRQRNPS